MVINENLIWFYGNRGIDDDVIKLTIEFKAKFDLIEIDWIENPFKRERFWKYLRFHHWPLIEDFRNYSLEILKMRSFENGKEIPWMPSYFNSVEESTYFHSSMRALGRLLSSCLGKDEKKTPCGVILSSIPWSARLK